MKVSITTLPLSELDVDLLIFPIAEGETQERLKALSQDLSVAVRYATEDFKGKIDDAVLVYPERARAKRLALVGMGAAGTLARRHRA